MALQRDDVMAALRTVQDPEIFKDIVTLNMVKDVRLDGDQVFVTIELTTPACPLRETIKQDVERALQRAGAQTVTLEFTANTRGPAGPRRDPGSACSWKGRPHAAKRDTPCSAIVKGS